MKRPFCLFTLIALSGILCGLTETEVRWKLAAAAGLIALCLWLWENSGPAKWRLFFFYAISLLGFAAGFLRAERLSAQYNSGEAAAFFAEKAPRNPGEFDYALYLKSKGIASEAALSQSRGQTHEGEGEAKGLLASIRSSAATILQETMTETDAGLYQAILLGDKSRLPDALKQQYQRAGISHVIAISGLHLSVIGMGLFQLLRRLPLGIGAAGGLTTGFIVAYGLMTGASASAMRAVIMLALRFAALRAGRKYDMRTAVAVAALLLAILHPYLLLQSGFLLSFGAVIGICVAADEMGRGLDRRRAQAEHAGMHEKNQVQQHLPKQVQQQMQRQRWQQIQMQRQAQPHAAVKKAICQTLLIDLCIQLCTLPILVSSYYTVSLYGILFNLLVVPLMTIVLCSGLLTLLCGGIGQLLSIGACWPLSTFVSAPGHYILCLYEQICNFNQKLPFHSLIFGRPDVLQCLLYYGFLTAIIWYFFARLNRVGHSAVSQEIQLLCMPVQDGMRRFHAEGIKLFWQNGRPFLLLLLLPLVLLHVNTLPQEALQLTTLDVGQGDGFVLQYGGQTILIDGGSSSNKKLGERVLEPYLLSQGIRGIDMAFVSHSDLDHISGILYLLQTDSPIHIRELILPKAAREQESYECLKTAYLAKEADGQISYLSEGDCICRKQTEDKNMEEQEALKWKGAGKKAKKREQKRAQERAQKKAKGREQEQLHLCCLDAGNLSPDANVNSHSPTMLLRYGAFSMLFTGDMAEADEQRLYRSLTAEQGQTKHQLLHGTETLCSCQIEEESLESLPFFYKSAHHGSKTSNSDCVLKLFRPSYALLSYGEGNRYGHPSPEVLQRFQRYGTELLETAKLGAITIQTDGRQLRCYGWVQ